VSRPGDELPFGKRGAPDDGLDTALLELDSAEQALQKAPKIEVLAQCIVQEPVVINLVTPSVTVDRAEGFHDAHQFLAAQVTLRLAESTGHPAYGGTGIATVVQGNGALFSDATCLIPLAQPLSAAALIQGVPAYVKGGGTGAIVVRLTLTDPGHPLIHVVPHAAGGVTISPVNVVTPSVTVDEADGFFDLQQFRAAQVTLKIMESTGAPSYGGTGTATVTEGNAALFSDASCTAPLAQPISAGALLTGVPAYVKGGATGKVTVRLALSDPGDIRVRVVPQAAGSVVISPVNVVTPRVSVDQAEGFFHAQQFQAAQVTLSLEQSTGSPSYGGTGTATVVQGSGKLFSDASCKTPLAQPLSAEALLKGVPAYVKGGATGKVSVRLALTDPRDQRLRVVPNAADSVAILPVNVVTPSVTVVQAEGFFHAQQFHAAQVTLKITESTGSPAFGGTGTAAVTEGNATLFSDAQCSAPLDQPLPASALLKGVPAYVKGGATGRVSVGLTLTDPRDPRIRAVPQAADRVTISPVNVITPVLTGDELVLVHDGFNAPWGTTPSTLRVSFRQSNPARSPPDLGVQVAYGNQVACFENATLTTAFNTGTTLARARLNAPFPLHVRGATQGDCTVTATATGTANPAWLFAPAVSKTLRVEQLTVDAYEYRDGLVVGGGGANIAGGGPPRRRELHEHNGNVFTFARFVMRQPNAAFWTKASQITLTAHHGVSIFSDQACTAALVNLVQGDFAGGDVTFWVRSANAARGLTAEPGHGVGLNWAGWAAHAPEQENATCYVSCGATDSTTNHVLRLGDLVQVDTFSLDRTLDRQVRNECGNRVIGVVGDLQRNSALSRVQAHRYYGYQSGAWVNHYYRANGSSPFTDFINYINASHTVAARPGRGANFIENHLLNQHGVALDPVMKTRIRNYIANVLGGGAGFANDFGFQRLYGLPGTHAECLAANEMVLAGVAPAHLTVATYMLQAQNGRQGKRFVACPNCQGVLNGGFRVITG
jgi:hypothetical protein